MKTIGTSFSSILSELVKGPVCKPIMFRYYVLMLELPRRYKTKELLMDANNTKPCSHALLLKRRPKFSIDLVMVIFSE